MLQAARSKIAFRAARPALPMLALAALWLLLLPPLVQRGLMTCSHDGALHLLRAFQLDTMVQQGVFWPRWIPGMVLGYGYPIFNFYPILSLYPAVILHRLGVSLLSSWNLSLALSMLASGWMMYLWAKQVIGPRGGFVSAAAYMLAPYQLYDAYWRGSLAETMALPLFPLVLWAAWRTAQGRRWRSVLAGALAYAAVLLTHVLSGFMFTPILLTYLVVLVALSPRRRDVLVRFAAMLILGLGLAVFFLAPAALESSSVQLWRGIAPTGLNYRNHFLTLGELLGPAPASDPLLVNPSPPPSLGWATGLLALVGILITGVRRARLTASHNWHVVWAGLILAGVLAMTLSVAEPVWAHLPGLPFVQFPWRWLGLASLLASLLAGAALAAVGGTERQGTLVMSAGLVMIAASILPWAYPRMCSAPDAPTQSFFTKYERSTGVMGTTSSGEYLPVAVSEVPSDSPMVRALRAEQPVSRWDAPESHVVEARDAGLSAELELESDAPVQVVYRAFYFPGWQAACDGQPIPISVLPPLGLMSMEAPAGRHTLALRFGSTPVRSFGGAISSLVAILMVAMWIHDRRAPFLPMRSDFSTPRPAVWLGLAGLGLALLALRLGVVDRFDTPFRWRRLQNGQLYARAGQANAVIAERARLLGYDVHPDPAVAGDVVMVDLYWALDVPFAFRAAVRLIDDQGLEWSDKDELYAARGGYSSPPPSIEWPPGAYADDRHSIRVLPGTPPGTYQLVVVPFHPDTLEPYPITFGQHAPGDYPGVVIGALEVVAPARPQASDSLHLAVRLQTPMGDDLSLIGYSQDRQAASPGEGLSLALGWQARRQPRIDYAARLELVTPDDQILAHYAVPLGRQLYPTSRWRPGQVILSQVLARVPRRAPSGQYTWRVVLLDDDGVPVGLARLGTLEVDAPERIWTAPSMPNHVDVPLGEWTALVGSDASQSVAIGQALKVTLVWQARAETDQDYKVFVHLLTADGRVGAQSDTVPAGWSRPTSGWLAGEYVVDAHSIEINRSVAPGDYTLVAGMYASDGKRLLTPDGQDRVELGLVRVVSQ